MRLWLTLLAVTLSVSSAAADYIYLSVNRYDPTSGLFFRSIEREAKGFGLSSGPARTISNIAIFDPKTDKTWLLFKEPPDGGISMFAFESEFKDGKIDFGAPERYSLTMAEGPRFALNNSGVAKREPKDKLLIAVRSKKETQLYVALKTGEGLRKVATVPENGDWHIDVKNSKLRILRLSDSEMAVESLDW